MRVYARHMQVKLMRINCLTKLQLINTHKCVFTTRVLRELNAHFGQLGIVIKIVKILYCIYGKCYSKQSEKNNEEITSQFFVCLYFQKRVIFEQPPSLF